MAKTYKKISGTWYPIKKIFQRISGTWREIKKLYQKVSGTWRVVHSGAYEYTFTANASNVNFATLIGASAVADNTDFIITVNSGVTISGTNGTTGANNSSYTVAAGNVGTRVCKDSLYSDGRTGSFFYDISPDYITDYNQYYTGNGGNGGGGNHALNLSGLSGKNITIINNGMIRGGNGGNGGIGARNTREYSVITCSVSHSIACGVSGSGGSFGNGVYNPNANTINIEGNTPINGSVGLTGSYGWTTFWQDQGCS